jgi:hypothetical protein
LVVESGEAQASPPLVREVEPSFWLSTSQSRIGKRGIEFSVPQTYFQSYFLNPSIGHRRVAIRACGNQGL